MKISAFEILKIMNEEQIWLKEILQCVMRGKRDKIIYLKMQGGSEFDQNQQSSSRGSGERLSDPQLINRTSNLSGNQMYAIHTFGDVQLGTQESRHSQEVTPTDVVGFEKDLIGSLLLDDEEHPNGTKQHVLGAGFSTGFIAQDFGVPNIGKERIEDRSLQGLGLRTQRSSSEKQAQSKAQTQQQQESIFAIQQRNHESDIMQNQIFQQASFGQPFGAEFEWDQQRNKPRTNVPLYERFSRPDQTEASRQSHPRETPVQRMPEQRQLEDDFKSDEGVKLSQNFMNLHIDKSNPFATAQDDNRSDFSGNQYIPIQTTNSAPPQQQNYHGYVPRTSSFHQNISANATPPPFNNMGSYPQQTQKRYSDVGQFPGSQPQQTQMNLLGPFNGPGQGQYYQTPLVGASPQMRYQQPIENLENANYSPQYQGFVRKSMPSQFPQFPAQQMPQQYLDPSFFNYPQMQPSFDQAQRNYSHLNYRPDLPQFNTDSYQGGSGQYPSYQMPQGMMPNQGQVPRLPNRNSMQTMPYPPQENIGFTHLNQFPSFQPSQPPLFQKASSQRPSNISNKSGSQLPQTTSILSTNSAAKSGVPPASPFVESIKTQLSQPSITASMTLYDLQGHFVECSLDQQCSRFMQQRLEDADEQEKQSLFQEITNAQRTSAGEKQSHMLMKDVFGNYVVQKMFEYGSLNQRKQLFKDLQGRMFDLSCNQYGCRVVQKALEVLPTSLQDELVDEIRVEILRCVEDANGNHVVQKIVESIQSEKVQFIVEAFKGKVYEMSVHQFGCRVIQRMLEHCEEEQIRPILNEVFERILDLTRDVYGNYVISHVLEHGKMADKLMVVNKIKKKVLMLSSHKFGSNSKTYLNFT